MCPVTKTSKKWCGSHLVMVFGPMTTTTTNPKPFFSHGPRGHLCKTTIIWIKTKAWGETPGFAASGGLCSNMIQFQGSFLYKDISTQVHFWTPKYIAKGVEGGAREWTSLFFILAIWLYIVSVIYVATQFHIIVACYLPRQVSRCLRR